MSLEKFRDAGKRDPRMLYAQLEENYGPNLEVKNYDKNVNSEDQC